MIKEIAYTIYAVSDIAKARAFYEGVLGLTPSKPIDAAETPMWVEYKIGEGYFAIGCSPEWKPSKEGAAVAFEAENFDEAIESLKANNVPFVLEKQDYPSCHMAVVADPDENRVIIHKLK